MRLYLAKTGKRCVPLFLCRHTEGANDRFLIHRKPFFSLLSRDYYREQGASCSSVKSIVICGQYFWIIGSLVRKTLIVVDPEYVSIFINHDIADMAIALTGDAVEQLEINQLFNHGDACFRCNWQYNLAVHIAINAFNPLHRNAE